MFRECTTEEIIKMIEDLNHEINLSDDNREQEYLKQEIIKLQDELKSNT